MAEVETLQYASQQQRGGLDPNLRIRLSVMMVLQYATWGALFSVLGKYMMTGLNFSGDQVGLAYGTTGVASMISPIVFGHIADRWMPTQRLLGLLHLGAAAAMLLLPTQTAFWPFYALLLAWALLYVPTISLSNALAFHHINDVGRYFPGVRVFGTIGWILVGVAVGRTLNESSGQPAILAGVLGIAIGLYCFTLPHTPPSGKPGDTWPPLRALGMLKEPQFALFVFVSFLIAMLLAAYFAFTATYLAAPPRNLASAADWMTLGQFAEMIMLPLLPVFLRVIGMKWTLILGIAAWGVRYGIFAVGQPTALVIASLALHGICYDFFFVAAYIHVDNQASAAIRASAQALFNFVVLGVGWLIGNVAFGRLVSHYTTKLPEGGQVVDWESVWLYPAVGVVVPVLILILFFRGKAQPAQIASAA